MEEKLDRRVMRTHQLLGDALIALTAEKGYDKVTIKEITERANVAYVTFFRHYKDKDELLAKRLELMLDELEAITHLDNRETEGLQIFRYVQQHSTIFRIVLDNVGTQKALKRIKSFVAAHLINQCKPLRSRTGVIVPQAVVANHITAALFGLIEWWLEQGMPYSPEEMAQMYEELIVPCVEV